MVLLAAEPAAPKVGDLILAKVVEPGQHKRIELMDGRRSLMFVGDEIIVCYGNRYAPDQFEAVIGPDLATCDLVAAGGIAAIQLSRHERMDVPTRIEPLGFICDGHERHLNVCSYGVKAQARVPTLPVIFSLGTSMNAGKTLTATSIMRGLRKDGLRTASLKITGTGAGGDTWLARDAGADVVLDFTDAGFATTYLAEISVLEKAAFRLINYAAAQGCDVAVIEIADGLQQIETAALVALESFRRIAVGVAFAAYDAMGAKSGVQDLTSLGHRVLGVSGRLTQAPLAVRETEAATGLRTYSPVELASGALNPVIARAAADKIREGQRSAGLLKLAGLAAPRLQSCSDETVLEFPSLYAVAPGQSPQSRTRSPAKIRPTSATVLRDEPPQSREVVV